MNHTPRRLAHSDPFTVQMSPTNTGFPWAITLPGVPMPVARLAVRLEASAVADALNAWYEASGDQDLHLGVDAFIDRADEYLDAVQIGPHVVTPWIVRHASHFLQAVGDIVLDRIGAGAGAVAENVRSVAA